MPKWLKVLRIFATVILGVLDLMFVLMIFDSGLRTMAIIMALMLSGLIALMYKPKRQRTPEVEPPVARQQNRPQQLQSSEYYNPHSRVGYRPANEAVKLNAEKYAVLDVETTGLSAGTDKIIEIAVVLCENGDEVGELDTLINPGIEIPQRITQLTGISDADVADAPNLAEVMPAVKEMIDGIPVVAHNAGFDMKFLAAAFDELGMKADIEYIDTLAMARKAYPGMPNHKLDTLIKELNLLDHPQTHRALDDVLATRKLYLACKATLKYTKTSPAPRPVERVAAPAPVYQSKKDKIRERIAAAEATGEAYCPKCGSTSLTANKKGYGIGKGVIGAAVAGPIGLAAGNLGRQKVLVTCLNCGYQFKPGKSKILAQMLRQ